MKMKEYRISDLFEIEDGGPICYLLPTQYTDWCGTCIGVSMQGLNLFPCKVKFTKHGNKYFADIL